MKGGITISLSLALAFGVFISPHFARAVESQPNQGNNAAGMQVSARQEAQQMVPATVALEKQLDARQLHPGDHFEAVLQRDVQLKNGPKLDRGAVLVGTVTTDQVQPGNARLAFRFTSARMKDGQTIPVKAMVIEVTRPALTWGTGWGSRNVAYQSGLWSPNMLHVDQIGAASGIDMHSAIASRNSAVLVSKKDDVKLKANSQIVVAIAERAGHSGMRKGA